MNLTPREKDKLFISMAANVARRRLERGVLLNYPEAVALITDFVVEGARDGKKVADLMEEARSKLVSALRYGNNLVIVMTKAVTDWNGVFTDESEECQKDENNVDIKDGRMCFPLEVFNNAGLALTQSKYTDHLYRDGEKESGFAVVRDPEKFRVILTTQFTPEDFEEFLFGNDWGMPKPKEKYAFIVVQSS